LIQKSPKDQDSPMQACGTAFWPILAPRLRQNLTAKKLLLWRVIKNGSLVRRKNRSINRNMIRISS